MNHLLLDTIKREFNLQNDSALAAFVGDTRPSISLIRSGKKTVPARLVLQVHKATKWPVCTIEALAKEQA